MAPHISDISYHKHHISKISQISLSYRKTLSIQQLTTFPKLNPPTSCYGSHSSYTSFTGTHLSPRYVNSLTVSTSSDNLSFCSTASPIFPSHFLHVKLLENFGVILVILAHIQWIHLPHCTHKTDSLYSQAADPTWINFIFRQATLCDAACSTASTIFP